MSSKVTVTVPFNVTFPVDGHVYREGDVFELERADAEKWLAAGALVEVKPAKKR
jgi:hypothetical protein